MNDELIKRLREPHPEEFGDAWDFAFACQQAMREAADAIEELSEDNAALNGTITNLLEQIKELGKPRWIHVSERLPEKNQIVVAVESGRTWDYGQFRGLAYLGGNKRKWNWKNNTTKTVDYWMLKKDALPKPPKEEN